MVTRDFHSFPRGRKIGKVTGLRGHIADMVVGRTRVSTAFREEGTQRQWNVKI